MISIFILQNWKRKNILIERKMIVIILNTGQLHYKYKG